MANFLLGHSVHDSHYSCFVQMFDVSLLVYHALRIRGFSGVDAPLTVTIYITCLQQYTVLQIGLLDIVT